MNNAEKHAQFSMETSLMISVVNPQMDRLSADEQELIITSIVDQYFEDANVKRKLTVVDGVAKNSNGNDVRKVCSKMVDDLIDEHGFFKAHGVYTVSNTGGYEVQISESGDAARLRDAYGSQNPKVSEWFEIEYIEDEDGEEGEEGELVPIIDPNGHNIPLTQVMRA